MKIAYKIIYKYIAKNMPESNSQLSFGAKKIRRYLTNKIVKKCGENVNIEKGAYYLENLEIGNNSGVGINCMILGKVKIGDNVMMGPEVYIYTKNHKFSNLEIPMYLQGFTEEKEVIIEDDVWIGSRVTILPGVKIGKGAVVGTGAVVTKDVAQYTIVAGNPAKVVGRRK